MNPESASEMNQYNLAQLIIRKYIVPSTPHDLQDDRRPYVLGLAGVCAATGTTKLAATIQVIMGCKKVRHIDLDDWITVSRSDRLKRGLAGIHPSVWDRSKLVEDLRSLIIESKPIRVPVYDHCTGTPHASWAAVPVAPVVCLAGAACFCPPVRALIDHLVAFHPAATADVKNMVITRNTDERGYSGEQAEADFLATDLAYHTFVRPLVDTADLAIEVTTDYHYLLRQSDT